MLLLVVGCGASHGGTDTPDEQADRASLGQGKDISWLYNLNPAMIGKLDDFKVQEDEDLCLYIFSVPEEDINQAGVHVYVLPDLTPFNSLQLYMSGGFPAVTCANGPGTQGCARVDQRPSATGSQWLATLTPLDIAGNWKKAQWIIVTSEDTFQARRVVSVVADGAQPTDYTCQGGDCFSKYSIFGAFGAAHPQGSRCPANPNTH
jgi:hypothetical protein